MSGPAVIDAISTRRPRRVSRGLVLIAGVILIPFALGVACNSWGPLTEESALRMAFAAVAGQTIAIIAALSAFVMTLKQRHPWQSAVFFGILGAVIVVASLSAIGTTGDLLITRLDIVEEVNRLNY